MAVPYTFSTIPNGQTIPLQYLDANFSYIETQIGTITSGVLTISGGATGLLPNIPTPGNVILSGTLNIANGGTGETTALAAINALLPSQVGQTDKYLTTDGTNASWGEPLPNQFGQAGKYLTTNGSTVSWGTIASAVTSFSGGTTGLTPAAPSGGAVTLAGTLAIANGGTGATTAQGATTNLLPTQTGNAGKVLSTDGSGVLTWIPAGGAASLVVGTSPIANGAPGGILYDNAGILGEAATVGSGNVVLDVGASITNATVTTSLLVGFAENELPLTIAAGAITIDCATATVFYIYLNSNITTINIANVPAAGAAYSLTLSIKADGTPRTITWPPAVRWPGGVAPTLTSTNNKVDTLVFYTYDAGTTWYGFVAGQNS